MATEALMRPFLLLLLTLTVAALIALFPDIATQNMRIEAFGWEIVAQQGAFMIALLLLLALLWLVSLLLASFAKGPDRLRQWLRLGSRKRAENRLREGLAKLIDMRGDLGEKDFRKAKGALPEWGMRLLSLLAKRDLTLPSMRDDPLYVALAARIASEPQTHNIDLPTRLAFLEAWLRVHPDAPLAMERLSELALEMGDWARAVNLLERSWKKGARSAAGVKEKLASAYLGLAKEDAPHALEYLRKAHRLCPENSEILLSLGRALIEAGDARSAHRLWLNHLQQHHDYAIAEALYEQLCRDAPLKAYQRLEKLSKDQMPIALQWLRAKLAHEAGLTGLAKEQMEAILERCQDPIPWQTKGDWHAQAEEWQEAVLCYRKACALTFASASSMRELEVH